ncbi:selenocysteine-specific translation elongation factor [Rossellomorea sp. YZS02]|uniref:selenocysteine-specific translation elongation factor n=1 Tax=Rossellomorea sp. YZS02 TaxID=3097358 RepID=UPI002A0D63DA|nr:selenocysteine-specific translation elongation factor [Rossellomorea sp. YZS02]MDX8343660.1 selenocysteine-specific translation elongation factor [Rossellomorea sp. YZS02]
MEKRYYTIGMAGHIDHGKTTLTKALTSVDTDRLKEEKERNISIEPGYAPLYNDDHIEISVVDVPGHERFIRQMIAGVAGIDLVVLVVAADEGVMPQTREHLDILSLLDIKQTIVVLTKISKVEREMVDLALEEIMEELKGTVFEGSPFLLVDSLSGEGVNELKEAIIHSLNCLPSRSMSGELRLPVDQVFTIKGQGTVVRGTVYEGCLETGQDLMILPQGIHTKAKQIQVHSDKKGTGYAGQRVAVNLSGVDYKKLKRGNVLVSSPHLYVSDTIDVCLDVLTNVKYDIKQRMPVMVHTGTSEVLGRLVFFDRNSAKSGTGNILCQIQLSEPIMAKRGDRFIVRRPSPVETIGGGWVIQPNGGKYRYGEGTIELLQAETEGTPKDRILKVLDRYKSANRGFLLRETSLPEERMEKLLQGHEWIELSDSTVTHCKITEECREMIDQVVSKYHKDFPLYRGINSGELKQSLKEYPGSLIDYALEKGTYIQESGRVYLEGFSPQIPPEWETRCGQLIALLETDGNKVRDMEEYFEQAGIPENWRSDFYHYFVQEKKIVPLDDRKAYSSKVYSEAITRLKHHTNDTFHIGEAKEVLGVSRKYMIPFLEKLDKEGLTIRMEGKRKWVSNVHKVGKEI